MKTTRMYQWNN